MNTKKKILVVDDDIDILSVVETILENEGYEVITAMTREDGLEKAYAAKPDLALLDVIMEDPYGGFGLAETLLKSPEFKGIKVVMQTSLRIFEANTEDILKMARYYRQQMEKRDIGVIMIMDHRSGKAGIDYCDEAGNYHWLEVHGVIRKPVTTVTLINEVKSTLKSEKVLAQSN